ncbi:VOC family protein [Microbacterium sp. NPDC087665]|uniref:VOC family protein n=1 Tax=Microbacterium sp. NPDC087665 TaxID=3364194 RepID=UPI00380D14F7
MAGFHHIEVWVSDLASARAEWGWLLTRLGFEAQQEWPEGQSWGSGTDADTDTAPSPSPSPSSAYLTITTSPNLRDAAHDRRRPGVNHLAFRGGTREAVDAIMADAEAHGWRPLYHDRYPHAGGPDHYAGWLQNSAGFKAEVVADLS